MSTARATDSDAASRRAVAPTGDYRSARPRRRPEQRADRQTDLIRRAEDLFPGGVNSPVRAFRSVGRPPLVLDAGDGARVRDANGRWYIDYIGAWGPAILGHAHPAWSMPSGRAALDGFALGATSPREVELGEAIRAAMPSMEKMRFTSSGTEAVMSAIRLARGATGRDLVLKFAGGYHGHSDGLLVEAGFRGRDARTAWQRRRAGAPWPRRPIVVPYNDLDAVRVAFENHAGRDRGGHRRTGRGQRRRHPARTGLSRGSPLDSRLEMAHS